MTSIECPYQVREHGKRKLNALSSFVWAILIVVAGGMTIFGLGWKNGQLAYAEWAESERAWTILREGLECVNCGQEFQGQI